MTVRYAASKLGGAFQNHFPSKNELSRPGDRLGASQSLRSPLEIKDFLRKRMAVCLPRIGAMGRHHSETSRGVAPLQHKPVPNQGRRGIKLREIAGCQPEGVDG